jgi:signal transduction histidine kinase
MHPLAKASNIKMAVRVKEHVPALKGDPPRLREALQGILINAVGNSQAGGKIEVTVTTGPGEAYVALHREYSPAREFVAPVPAKTPRRKSPRKLSDVYAALLWARAKLILKAHGGAVRTENHGAQGQSWWVTLPIAVHQHARKA